MDTIRRLGSVSGYAIDQDASERIGYVVHKLVFEGTCLIFYRVDESASEVRVVNFDMVLDCRLRKNRNIAMASVMSKLHERA